MSVRVRTGLCLWVSFCFCLCLAMLPGCQDHGPTGGLTGGIISGSWEPQSEIPASAELLKEGATVYAQKCAACHGADGTGNGEAAYLLYPKPRDFVTAHYRLVSTWEAVPTDRDLFRTISRGMPGSAMASWSHLPEPTRWALVHYIKSLAESAIEVSATQEGVAPTGVIQPPPRPPYDSAQQARAAKLFAQGCAPCHGATGKGDGAKEQFDDRGFPTRPRDLTLGVYKGVPEPEHVYRRIVSGLPGTPMPSNAYLHGGDAWALTEFVLSMSSEEQRQRAEMYKFRIMAHRVEQLPSHPDDGLWQQAPRVNLHLMPLWWLAQRPEELTVQVLHDAHDIAMLVSWSDDTHDQAALRPQDFRDAAAVQFALQEDPPLFAMGTLGNYVNIWMWKSERQADLDPAYQDLEKVYPNIGIDAYPNPSRSPLEQPLRNALTLESDPTFVTGWGAGNIVSDPTRKSPVEDLTAQGFGTLSARPKTDQVVQAQGVYSTGSYRVLFRRSLSGQGEHSVRLKPGAAVSVAFAVWNGHAGDRDGKKSVTIWQELVLEP